VFSNRPGNGNTAFGALNQAGLSALPQPIQIQGKAASLMVVDNDASKTGLIESFLVLQVSNGQSRIILWHS